ncbi:MAG TPA: DMT family transporter [Rectinemataceae bacterium]|nr:DMT family transporter [Rectinemataceae bacterium]
MERLGAFAAFGTAVFWTASAIAFEGASKRVGALAVNFWKVTIAFFLLALSGLLIRGSPLPLDASAASWRFLALSGFIGFVISDYFLFNAYVLIGSRVTVVFQALTPLFAAGFGYLVLGQAMQARSLAGMGAVVSGITILVIARNASKARTEAGERVRAEAPGAVASPHSGAENLAVARVGGRRSREGQQLKGYVFAFLSTVFQALGLVTSKLGLADIGAIPATQIRVLAAIVGFGLQALILRRGREVFVEALRDRSAAMRIAAGSIVGPFLGVVLSLFALQHTDVGTASSLMALTPVLIIAPAILLMRQRVAAMEVVGAAIAVGGTALFFMA